MSTAEIRPIPNRPKTAALAAYLGTRSDLTAGEKRARLVLDKAISAVSASKVGDALYRDAPGGNLAPFVALVRSVFDALWDAGE